MPCFHGRALRRACRAAGFEPNVRYTSSEATGLFAAVKWSGAVSLVPALACQDAPSGLHVLQLSSERMRRRVFAAHRRGDPVRPSVRVVIDRLAAAVPCVATAPHES